MTLTAWPRPLAVVVMMGFLLLDDVLPSHLQDSVEASQGVCRRVVAGRVLHDSNTASPGEAESNGVGGVLVVCTCMQV